ncbi:MAG: PQQ-dependent sugar dehydrogenase [Blastocatellia bacterium]|jgi:glucose/arabinose dehydrogenase
MFRRFFFTFTLVTSMFLAVAAQDAPNPEKTGRSISQKVGDRIVITPSSLPKPFETKAVANGPRSAPAPAGAALAVPAGFEVKVFAEGDFQNPRWMIEGANGDLFLADSRANNVVLLRDTNKDGRIDNATERFVFATGLNQPFGLAIQAGWFYIANTSTVVRFKYEVGQTSLTGEGEKIIDLPGQGYRQHWTRNLLFSRDGRKLFVSVGSESNVSEEPEPRRAAISEYNPDGTGHRIFASGIRNPIGLAWNPVSGQLWTAVNERDGLGDDLVPDYVTSVKDGGFYGWPYAYIGSNEEPRLKGKRPDLVAKAIVPDVLVEPHAAALGLTFYNGRMFPKEYVGDAFVALHGSWNRALRSGYKVVRIPFKNGKPEGGYENFMTGWVPDEKGREVWGRPVGVTVIRDGSLLVVDDGGNKVWRITYNGRK